MTQQSKDLRIPHDELTRICIECSSCGTETIIDMKGWESFTLIDEYDQLCWKGEVNATLGCPVCQRGFDSGSRDAVTRFASFFAGIERAKKGREFKDNVYFRVASRDL
jgi:hypothetical protein